MTEVFSAALFGRLPSYGELTFLRVEWWHTAPRMALLKFMINGRRHERGLRLDLDKRAFIDRLEDDGVSSGPYLDHVLDANSEHIWKIVIQQMSEAEHHDGSSKARDAVA